jgi:hypothetical protein
VLLSKEKAMKSTMLKALTTSVASLAVCASAIACPGGGGGGGGYRPYPTNPYPIQYSNPRYGTTTSNYVTPASLKQTTAVTPAVPQARITTVAETAPVGKLQIASPKTTEDTAKVETKVETAKTDEVAATKDAIEAKLASLKTDSESSPKIADGLKGLVGTWMAVSRQGDGELSTVELQLDDNGWAKLTVPGADGKPSTTSRKVEFENNELKLTGGDVEILLGKLVDSNSRQMVLERSGSQVTFVRP